MAKGGNFIGKQKNLDRNKNGRIDSEDLTMIRENRMADGGGVKGNYFKELEANFSSTRKGGVKNYSVDIDLENGEQLRGGDLDFKDYLRIKNPKYKGVRIPYV